MQGRKDRIEKIGKIARILALFLSAFFYARAFQSTQKLQEGENAALLLLEASPLTAQQAFAMQEAESEREEPVEFAAWGQETDVTLENTEFQRSCTVSAVTVCGRSDLVLKGSARLDTADTLGCLIDTDTALALFGSTDVTGLTVTLKGTDRIIRGLLYNVQSVILFEADIKSSQALTALTVFGKENETPQELQQDFLARYSVSGELARLDLLTDLADLISVMSLLIPEMLLLGQLLKMARSFRKQAKARQQKRGGVSGCFAGSSNGFLLAAAFFCGIFTVWLTLQRLSLPADMIPTRWSDFAYLESFWENTKSSLLLLALMEKTAPVRTFLKAWNSAWLENAAGLIFFALAGRKRGRIV